MDSNFRNSVAYAARDRMSIVARRSKSLVFSAVRKLTQAIGQEPARVSTIACYPPAENLENAADLYNRLHWYFGSSDLHICLPTPYSEVELQDAVAHLEHQLSYLNYAGSVQLEDSTEADSLLAEADAVLVWDASSLRSVSVLRQIGRVFVIDPQFYSLVECSSYSYLLRSIETKDHFRMSRENFGTLQDEYSNVTDAYVFATGPSLDMVFDLPVPDQALKVVCNSIVRSDSLLAHIQPDVLTFADPVFHLGPSKYAARFRADAVRAVKKYNCWCIVNTPGDMLMRTHFPEIADRVIGIPTRRALSTFHFPRADELCVRPTGNIMLKFMLPVASSFADKIHVFGADGREKNESYFWKHSSIAQYEGLMNSAVQTHPSFFRDRLYEDYYDKHVDLTRECIEYGESLGKQYDSLTPSHIPALRERQAS